MFIDCYLLFIFFVIIFKIFLKNSCLCKYIDYLYTIEITNKKIEIMKSFKLFGFVLAIGTNGICLVNVKNQKITFKLSY